MRIFVLTGSPCSGKSTLAEQLAPRLQAVYFKVDDRLEATIDRAAQEGRPVCSAARKLDLDGTWLRPPRLQCDEEFALYREVFPYVWEEALAAGDNVLAEGVGLLPELLPAGTPAICILPTPAFQVTRYRQRDWAREMLSHTSRPEEAFENWMQRDMLFAEETAVQAERRGIPVWRTDETTDFPARLEAATAYFTQRDL